MSQAGAEEGAGLLDLPPAVLEAVVALLYPDARAVERAACACTALRRAADSVDWAAWLASRFGRDALPAAPVQGARRTGGHGGRCHCCCWRQARSRACLS